ncbi:Abi family protein [Acetanaerobacterium sp. MSJ-12]|uniref:Abi family protein n=1 Tax=Acetanaerobacterium sp. MSJ-12 TaxID=2841535 RepID=UPI001C0F3A56|nr:Abi family protein [Acetanaerobacterium sp. MSJ-12]MBU5419593.1 Abi family protein [Acetanaerobacterium sp. MSJ-12]
MPRKPMLCVDDLIEHSKKKGIRFDIMSEQDAKNYLDSNNNYFKLTSYRKNYAKITTGEKEGQYVGLDFAHLIELARIDVEIRHILLKMCLDIEHFLKVRLIKAVENNTMGSGDEDGYKIVTDFLVDAGRLDFGDRATNISKRSGSISRKIRQNKKNPYCKGLMEKYKSDMPIWAFVEVISFGDLEDLISFYSESTGWEEPVDKMSLDRVRQIRNAAAHSNCIINDLRPSKTLVKTPLFITQFVSKAGIGEHIRGKKLSNGVINQIVHLLYVYSTIVTSENTRQTRLSEVKELFNTRLVQHHEYFADNELLKSSYEFFYKLISSLLISD